MSVSSIAAAFATTKTTFLCQHLCHMNTASSAYEQLTTLLVLHSHAYSAWLHRTPGTRRFLRLRHSIRYTCLPLVPGHKAREPMGLSGALTPPNGNQEGITMPHVHSFSYFTRPQRDADATLRVDKDGRTLMRSSKVAFSLQP